MDTDRNRVIVSPDLCNDRAIHTTRLHHRDFPEMHTEGESPAAAATHLANLLVRALDNTPSDYRRIVAAQALADVRAFVSRVR
jgi:hypothetical protein